MRGQMQFAAFAAWSCLAVLTASGTARGQEKGQSGGKVPCYFGTPESGARRVDGIRSCTLCHGRTGASSELALPDFQFEDDGFVLLNELVTWAKDDKHYQAYAVLHNDRSKEMARRLGIVEDPKDPNSKSLIHLDARCLGCHSSVPLKQIPRRDGAPNLASVDTLADPRYNLGVSCEGCHGPSSKLEGDKAAGGWAAAHWQDPKWRTMPAGEKYNDYGFWDVRSARSRAKICLSCHVGNVDEGKVVTHEMYAAGHPPLPSFELVGFVAQEPRHWRNLEDKAPKIRDAFLKARGEKMEADELRQTRALMVSALMSVSESMRLSADLIEVPEGASVSGSTWPELANFSCYACHHDLKRDGWRQSRPRTSVPGRPTLHEWPTAMAMIAAGVMGEQDELKKQMDEVQTALNAAPFGENKQLLAATRKLADTADTMAVQLEAKVLREADGKEILKKIATYGSEDLYDYDTARQLVWAYERVYAELLKKADKSAPAAATEGEVDQAKESENTSKALAWKGWMVQEKPLTESQQILKSLESSLVLDLRTGSTTTTKFPGERQARPQTDVDLSKTLPVLGSYDPATVQGAFKRLLVQPAP